jgi:hypothetical protein
MKYSAFDQTKSGAQSANPLKRRGLLGGAVAAGAAVVAVAAVKGMPGAVAGVAPIGAEVAVNESGGYQLTQHVLRYYETTKI